MRVVRKNWNTLVARAIRPAPQNSTPTCIFDLAHSFSGPQRRRENQILLCVSARLCGEPRFSFGWRRFLDQLPVFAEEVGGYDAPRKTRPGRSCEVDDGPIRQLGNLARV